MGHRQLFRGFWEEHLRCVSSYTQALLLLLRYPWEDRSPLRNWWLRSWSSQWPQLCTTNKIMCSTVSYGEQRWKVFGNNYLNTLLREKNLLLCVSYSIAPAPSATPAAATDPQGIYINWCNKQVLWWEWAEALPRKALCGKRDIKPMISSDLDGFRYSHCSYPCLLLIEQGTLIHYAIDD